MSKGKTPAPEPHAMPDIRGRFCLPDLQLSPGDLPADLGGQPEEIGRVFAGFQKYFYAEQAM